MKILMFTWEFPPFISGGLGTACYGIVSSLLKQGVAIDLVLPTAKEIYFPLRKIEDVDIMPIKFLETKKQELFEKKYFKTVKEKLNFVGVSSQPESYLTPATKDGGYWTKFLEEEFHEESLPILQRLSVHLSGEEDIFRKSREMAVRAAKYASTLDFDLIHVHDWLTSSCGITAKLISNKPMIFHMHATEFDRAGGPGDERIHKLEYTGMDFADLVIAVSAYTAEMVINRYRIDTAKIRVVHNALDIEEKKIPKSELRLFKDPTILFLGRITLQKGPDYFLEVAKQIIERHPSSHFIMAGAGDMMRKMVHKSAYYKLKNRFLFTGFLNKKQVGDVFGASDIFVMPSISEPFGIVPLEAMGYEVVSIISKQSGVAEVVKNAFVIDFWDIKQMVDTICYLIENPQEREKTAKAGKEEVIKIQWDNAVEKIIGIYKELLC